MTADHDVIRRTFEPADLAPLLARAGVAQTVLVQAACTDADTDSMFAHAARTTWIGGVVAWVDLRSPERARERLDELSRADRSCAGSATSSTTSPTRTGSSGHACSRASRCSSSGG